MAGITEQKQLTLEEVGLITQQALMASGLSASAASAITDVVTQAERDECHSHGLFRVPGYCSGVIAGKVNGTAEPVVHDVAPGVVRVDACGGYAPSAILAGREAAVAKVRQSGIACLAIHNSAHFAALWWEVESLARDGIGAADAQKTLCRTVPSRSLIGALMLTPMNVALAGALAGGDSVVGFRKFNKLCRSPRRQAQALRHKPYGYDAYLFMCMHCHGHPRISGIIRSHSALRMIDYTYLLCWQQRLDSHG
jgi:hypothetical protein